MKIELKKSLKRDELIFKIIKKNLKKTNETFFNYKVKIPTKKYIEMIKSRYISSLLNMNKKDLERGVSEIKSKFQKQIYFIDSLKCIIFTK